MIRSAKTRGLLVATNRRRRRPVQRGQDVFDIRIDAVLIQADIGKTLAIERHRAIGEALAAEYLDEAARSGGPMHQASSSCVGTGELELL